MAQMESAAGDANIPVDVPATDPIDALVDEFLGDEEEEPTADEDPDPEFAEEDDAGEEAELPPIAPPVSLTAEEKSKFASLPRDAQEIISRRVGDLERGFQTKAQEAAQTRAQVEREALAFIQQERAEYAQKLQHYASQFEVPQPDPQLIVEDPETYAHQMRQFQYATAQREQAQRDAEHARLQAQQAQQAIQAQEAQELQAVLSQHFPEFLDPSNAKLREELGSIAIELGYPGEQLKDASATDILAMRKASEWKAKAEKFDTLMAKKMETVRAAKDLPKVARPGAASTRAQVSAGRAASAWERTKATKSGSDFADFLEASGIKL